MGPGLRFLDLSENRLASIHGLDKCAQLLHLDLSGNRIARLGTWLITECHVHEIQESQGLTTYAFVLLLLAMISLHMLTFGLMVTMVAEFCSLVILIHNALLGEITISST